MRLATSATLLCAALILGCADRREDAKPAALRFEMCPSQVASVEVIPARRGPYPWGVYVGLSQDATAEFERVTAEHIGEELQVTFDDGEIFLQASIATAIRSGVLSNIAYETQADAERVRERILGSRSERCGAVPKALDFPHEAADLQGGSRGSGPGASQRGARRAGPGDVG